jgi:hypothetical protein
MNLDNVQKSVRHDHAPADRVPIDPGVWSRTTIKGRCYLRRPVRTHWLTEDDDLAETLDEYLRQDLGEARCGDTLVVSEKVAVLLTGRAVPVDAVQVSRLARLLARSVRPRQGSRGLSVPEKMAYVVHAVGTGRMLAAAVAGAVTRPLGVRGVFYRIAGPVARDLDGCRAPYEQLLFPPLPPAVADDLCGELERALGVGVAIVDLNDFGGSIRAVSPTALRADTLLAVLADNPLRQRLTGTPFGIVRPQPA